MNIDEYISDLRTKHGILVTVSEEGNLNVKTKKEENLTPEIVGQLRHFKQEILDFHKTIKPFSRATIARVPEQESYPLSYAQRRLWVLDQLVEQGGLYNVPLRYRFSSVDFEVFHQSFRRLLNRHEILRTVIKMVKGTPRQFVLPIDQLVFEIDQQEVADDQLDTLLLKEARYRIDLGVIPLKGSLFYLPNGDVVFSLVLHHIVTDGWSVKVLSKDFNQIYEDLIQGRLPGLEPLPFQYKDYTLWQKNRISGGSLQHSKNYWHELFKDFEAAVDFPLDNPRGSEKHIGGSQVVLTLPPVIIDRLIKLGNGLGASFFMVCTSVIYTLLYRYTDQRDITLGTPITGRDHPELEDQVGYYSNTVVLRGKFDPEQGFRALLQKVYRVVLEAMEHQFYPFDLLVEELNIERDNSRNPLFDVMVSYHDDDQSHSDKGKISEVSVQDGGFNKFDLTFDFKKTSDNYLKVLINYDDHLFSNARMIRLSGHLKELITELSIKPDLALYQLNYLGQEEKKQLTTINTHQWGIDVQGGIKALFENQVKIIPDELALLSRHGNMTFSELNRQANQLGHYLINTYHSRVGDKVGISLDPGFNQIISLLAVIKIGGTYVPIELDQPDSQLQYVIEDTKAVLIISTEKQAQKLNRLGLTTLVFEDVHETLKNQSAGNPKINADHDHLAILYTSGTTGIPKGVVLTEKGIINRMAWLWKSREFSLHDVIYQKTSFLFDVSIGEIFMPLCFGARLLVESSDTSREILDNVADFNATYIHFSCTQLNRFLNSISTEEDKQLDSLRYVFSSGEAVQRETVNAFYERFEIPLINLYGPTEASIEVSYFETEKGEGPVPIGRPIANVQLFVLDEHFKMVGIGIPGEVYIGGVCLAHAYLNRKDLTDQRFLSDPFGQPGEKIFRTGDFGYWNESMQLEFLGRKDGQISINGSRIELDGIISRILAHEEIQEATLTVEKDQYKNYHLHAFYVRKTESQEQNGNDITQEMRSKVVFDPESLSGGKINYNIRQRLEGFVVKAVQDFPTKTAIIYKDTSLTYEELNNLSSKLAGQLIYEHGISSGNVVALGMKRSEKAIVAMLAILRAGGVYLPIDPDYPGPRAQYMLRDSGAQTVLLENETAKNFTTEQQTVLVYEQLLEAEGDKMSELVDYNPDALCYLCYTSGSTGNPKGVQVGHASVIDYVQTFIDYFSINSSDKVLQQSSLSFDTSVEEIFPALCCGATVVIQPDGGQDIDGIISSINNESISILSLTPMVMHELNLRYEEIDHFPRVIISGGDLLRPIDVNHLIHHSAIFNTYGPTETTICVAFGKVNKAEEAGIIGSPITNHSIYLLDDEMNLVKQGETGELFIAGNGVAKGYINNPKETSFRFVNDPFQGGRMYKTGDLAKWTVDGRLVFQGRKDNQVKIRGYRIELSEIEHQLTKHPNITDVVSVAKAAFDGVKKIIAYYTADVELSHEDIRRFLKGVLPIYMVPSFFIKLNEFPRNLNNKLALNQLPLPASFFVDQDFTARLKEFLKESLPTYMIPSHFIPLQEMPTTVSGKVNRKALKQISNSFLENPETIVEPRNHIERAVLQVWKDCLKQADISVEANFFELGGDSIKAMQIVAGVSRKLDREVALKDIMNHPTISSLAAMLNSDSEDQSLQIKLNEHQPELPKGYFVPPITGSSTIFQPVSHHLEGLLNCIGLQYPGFESAQDVESSVENLANTLVQEINGTDQLVLVGYSMGAVVAFEMAKLLEKKNVKVKLVLIDRGPNTEDTNLDEGDLHQVIDNELKKWFGEMGVEIMTRTKTFIIHNNEVLAKYRPSGMTQGPMLTIEAGHNKMAANTHEWKAFVKGDFLHRLAPTHHYGILGEAFEKSFANLLIQFINQKENY